MLVGPLGSQGHRAGDCSGGIEDSDWRKGGGGGCGFVRSKSFKTGETLFLKNIKVTEMCAVYSENVKIGF